VKDAFSINYSYCNLDVGGGRHGGRVIVKSSAVETITA
jgi:hypothetical protein